MGKRTDDRSVIDVVPNGVAFNLAKSWLGLVKKKKDDEDDGNADRSENENVNNNNETFSLEAFRRESQREEEEETSSTSGRPGARSVTRVRAGDRSRRIGHKYAPPRMTCVCLPRQRGSSLSFFFRRNPKGAGARCVAPIDDAARGFCPTSWYLSRAGRGPK